MIATSELFLITQPTKLEKRFIILPIDLDKREFPSGIAFLCGLAKKLNVMEGFYYDTWEQKYPEPEYDEGEDY